MDFLSIDPGKTTGYAIWQGWSDSPFYSGQVEDRFAFESTFRAFIAPYTSNPTRGLSVVMEDFIISAQTVKKSRQDDPLRIIGYVEGLCHEHLIPFKLQTPSEAKQFATDEKLKALRWYYATPGGHANDAARHLLRRLHDEPDVWPLLASALVTGLAL